MVYVVKSHGEKEKFDKRKVYKTCIRSGAPEAVAQRIADETERFVSDGMTTRKVLKFVLKKLRANEEKHALKYDLKQALSELDSNESEFERYIEHLLRAHGYETKWNVIVRGEIIEHQIDIIASLKGKRYLVECKHHKNPYRETGLGDVLEIWAKLDDIQEGLKKGKTKEKADVAWVITNTSFSQHALNYAKGKGMKMCSWSRPRECQLRDLIEKKEMYPITLLNFEKQRRLKLGRAGILLVKELAFGDEVKLSRETKIPRRELGRMINRARSILG